MKYADMIAMERELEGKRCDIVRKYNELRKEAGYKNEEELLRQYCIEVSSVYWELSEFWRKAPESFRRYYKRKTGKTPCFCHALATDPADDPLR